MKIQLSLIALALTACSGPAIEADDEPTQEYLDFQQHIIDQYGEPRDLDPTQPLNWVDDLGEIPQMDDQVQGDIPGGVDKTQHAAGHGWALKGTSQLQDGIGGDECTLSGVKCDFLFHRQLVDRFADDATDFVQDNLGRCGSNEKNWLFPCALPKGTKAAGGKSWKYKIDLSSCPNSAADQPGRKFVNNGIAQAFAKISSGSGWKFASTTGNDWNILFKCGTTLGVSVDSLAITSPYGAYSFLYAAGQPGGQPGVTGGVSVKEVCDGEGGKELDGPNTINTIFDMVYTYKQFEVQMVWENIFQFNRDCRVSTEDNATYMIASIMLHEMGHGFGFIHQDWNNDHGEKGIMNFQMDCLAAVNKFSDWPLPMYWSMQDIDLRTSSPPTVSDGELSCLYPNK